MPITPEQKSDFLKRFAVFLETNKNKKIITPKSADTVDLEQFYQATEQGKIVAEIGLQLIKLSEAIKTGKISDSEISSIAGEIIQRLGTEIENKSLLIELGIATDNDYVFIALLNDIYLELQKWDTTDVFVKKEVGEKKIVRNNWERFLSQMNADEYLKLPDVEKLSPAEQEYELRKRYSQLRSIYHSIFLYQIKSSITMRTVKFPNLAQTAAKIDGVDTNFTASNLLDQMTVGLQPGSIEMKVAKEYQDLLKGDFDVLEVINTRSQELTVGEGAAAKSLDGIKRFYSVSGDSTHFDAWFWGNIEKLPAYAIQDESGNWHIENNTMGEKMFTFLQGILRRGRRTDYHDINSPVPKISMSLNDLPASVKAARVYLDGKWQAPVISLKNTPRDAVFPLLSGTSDEIPHRLSKIKEEKQRISETSDVDNDLISDWAAINMLALSDVLMEAAYQDSAKGQTNGLRQLEQLLNPTTYGKKAAVYGSAGSSVDRQYNLGLVGSIRSFYLTFFDFFGYNGETITEKIIKGKKFSDIDWQKLPQTATRDWYQSIQDGSSIAEVDLKGIPGGDLRSLGHVDIATADASKINKQYLEGFRKFFRTLVGYQLGRDSSAGITHTNQPGANNKPENPTGQFRKYICRNIQTGHEDVVISRIGSLYILNPQNLYRWIDVKPTDKDKRYIDEDGNIIIEYRSRQNVSMQNLIIRELLYKHMFATSYDGDVIKDIGKEDLLLFGMMLSQEIREDFAKRYYSGAGVHALTKLSEILFGEDNFFSVEIPNVQGPNILSKALFEEFLFYMGYSYKYEDLAKSGQKLLNIFGVK